MLARAGAGNVVWMHRDALDETIPLMHMCTLSPPVLSCSVAFIPACLSSPSLSPSLCPSVYSIVFPAVSFFS